LIISVYTLTYAPSFEFRSQDIFFKIYAID